METNKLWKIMLALAVAAGAMGLGSLTHASRGDTSILIEDKYSDLHVVALTAVIPSSVRSQFVDNVLMTEPPAGLAIVTLDGRVLFLRKDKNPAVRELMMKLDGHAGGPNNGIQEETPEKKGADGAGGGKAKRSDGGGRGLLPKSKKADGEGRGKARMSKIKDDMNPPQGGPGGGKDEDHDG